MAGFNFAHHTLRVEQTVGLERGRRWSSRSRKTEACLRTRSPLTTILAALDAHRERQQERRIIQMTPGEEQNPVFRISARHTDQSQQSAARLLATGPRVQMR